MSTKKEDTKPTGLDLMRVPFEKNQISRLPKPTKSQTESLKQNRNLGIRCTECGGWHHKDVIHLDYVGHAALTDRLLECDSAWNWEPVAFDATGAPLMDSNGGMWIKLTVCGTTRLGYGHPDGKRGGDAIKETIGDALRNAAMRFGAALDLWHKGDLHAASEPDETPSQNNPEPTQENINAALELIGDADTIEDLNRCWKNLPTELQSVSDLVDAGAKRKAQLKTASTATQTDDEIPY